MARVSKSIPRLIVAGVSSGAGKTTVTVALARALRARGHRVALFKCGPDYLDPTYHARAVDAPSQNLDGWMMGRDAVRATFASAARDADIAIVEGVMGLYDGATPTGEEGSTAEIAKWLDAPVVLVVDAGGMARSFAAVVAGFVGFDPAVRVAGAIANRVGGRGHLDLLRKALRAPPVVGGLPRDVEHAFAERHLGLRTADERVLPASLLDHWADQARAWLDLDALVEIARAAPAETIAHGPAPDAPLDAPEASLDAPIDRPAPRCRIGVAFDDAFHFYYEHNLRRLESEGAEIVRFSPVHDVVLPDVDGVYIGGGYPEVCAAELARNASMQASIAAFAKAGGPVYAECGGLMYLTRAIVTLDGVRHAMVGLLPTEARMCGTLQALGYVEVETQTPTILGGAGSRFRGHQFRYSELAPPLTASEVRTVYSLRRRRGDETTAEGYSVGNVIASYVHAHWASNPRIARELVESCARYREEKCR
jgi:cobyrinic acid a,c-diamide synthase